MNQGSLRQSVERRSVCKAYLILNLALKGIVNDDLILLITVFLLLDCLDPPAGFVMRLSSSKTKPVARVHCLQPVHIKNV